MTGKENVKRSIEFRSPAYLPAELGFDPCWLYEKNAGKTQKCYELLSKLKLDIINPSTYVHSIGEPEIHVNKKTWTDEWGTRWEDDGFGSKAVGFPLENGYEDFDESIIPDSRLGSHIFLKEELLKDDGTKYIRSSIWFTLFERMWMLRGFENMLIDPYIHTKNFEYLRDKILDFTLERIKRWAEIGVDGIFFSDDWGTQRGLLINPQDWRRYYKDAYKQMFRLVRDQGMHVWMHLCGDIRPILPDLIECGLNVLNPIQPQAMDIHKLAVDFGGAVCFNGGVDVQKTLVTGTADDVKREVYMLAKTLGRSNGGYIGATSHTIMPETPLDNIAAMFEAFIELQKS